MDNKEIPKGFTVSQFLGSVSLWKDKPDTIIRFYTDSGKELHFHHVSAPYSTPGEIKIILHEDKPETELKIFNID